jgi:Virulence factor membrane-bound polymerase, C-terminal
LQIPGRVLVLIILLLGGLSLQQLMTGYRNIEMLTALRPESGNSAAYYDRMNSGLAAMQKQLLLQPYADLFTSSMIEIDPEHLDSKLVLNGDVARFVPIAPVVYRQSLLLAQGGDIAAAQEQMERAIWTYPGDFQEQEELLRKLALKDPAHFAALLEFALQKHEEYQRAVHTK